MGIIPNPYRRVRPTEVKVHRPTTNVRVGWLCDQDISTVHRIEVASALGTPLAYSEVARAIRSRGVQKCVKVDEVIVAFAFYEIRHGSIDIKRLAVDPSHRRRGYGRMLVIDGMERLRPRRPSLTVELKESLIARETEGALRACRFLARCGFSSHVADRDGSDPSWMFTRLRRLWTGFASEHDQWA